MPILCGKYRRVVAKGFVATTPHQAAQIEQKIEEKRVEQTEKRDEQAQKLERKKLFAQYRNLSK